MTFLSSNKLKSKGFNLYWIFKTTKLKKKLVKDRVHVKI